MEITDREKIEWTNWWISDANIDKRRCLLIGDSTTRQIRSSIERLVGYVYAVDLFASSFALYDNMLMDNIETIFKRNEYMYDFIVLHYGGHHGFARCCCKSNDFYSEYYNNYERLVKFLLSKSEKIILMTGTSEVKDENIEIIDEMIEDEIKTRNRIVIEIGEKYNCAIFDLYTLMKNTNIYRYLDRQHFTRDADAFIGYKLLIFAYNNNILNDILIENLQLRSKRIIEKLLNNRRKCIIYGVGVWGNEIYWLLKWNKLDEIVKLFVVSKKNDVDSLNGKTIIEISDVPVELRKSSVLIICSEKYEREMEQIAINLQFNYIVSYKDVLSVLQ